MRSSVSVIIPCFKQGHFLPIAIESALGQTHSNVEVVVVDDGSPDDPASICQRYGSAVRCIRKANAGLSAARNTGILAATGEWLIFLDADDYLPTDALEQHLATAAAHPFADVFYGTYHYVDEAGKSFGPRFDPVLPIEPFHSLLMGTYFPPHAVMTRRRSLGNSGVFDVTLRSLEDWDMWIRLAAAGSRFVRTPALNVPYRQHSASMSKDFERMRACGMQMLLKNSSLRHPNCKSCQRALRAGRWAVREGFVMNTRESQRGGRWWLPRMLSESVHKLASGRRDPLLLLAAHRRRLRHAWHNFRRSAMSMTLFSQKKATTTSLSRNSGALS